MEKKLGDWEYQFKRCALFSTRLRMHLSLEPWLPVWNVMKVLWTIRQLSMCTVACYMNIINIQSDSAQNGFSVFQQWLWTLPHAEAMNLSCPWSILFLQGHCCSQWAQKKLLPSRQSRQRKPKVGLQKPRAFPRLLRFLMPRMRRWVLQAVDGMCFLMFFDVFCQIYYLLSSHHLASHWITDSPFNLVNRWSIRFNN